VPIHTVGRMYRHFKLVRVRIKVRLGVSVSCERNAFVGLYKSPSGGCAHVYISSLIVQSNLYITCQWKLEVTTGLDFSGSTI